MLMQHNDDTKSFPMSTALASALWIFLYESNQTELAQALASVMINEGAELDVSLKEFKPDYLLEFWAHHLLEEGVLKKVKLH